MKAPAPSVVPNPAPLPEPKKMPEKVKPTSATIEVSLPADATLTVDGKATQATGAARTFATPELAEGQVFYYTFTATVFREGKALTTTEQVAVKAGETTAVSL